MPLTEPVYYFAGSIRAGRDDVPHYNRIIAHLKKSGPVRTEHVGDYSLSLSGQTQFDDKYIHDRDLAWLRSANVVVAETTRPSLGVGYELAMATVYQIPIFALHRSEESSLSAMIAGCRNVTVIEYTDLDDALARLDHLLEGISG
ncbi:nucleoside 2-deoxyribosyltransferase [Glycomyces sp. NRRL B-16210]|uniref:nucleoside 2-deoxyribosyltransferase n=1 Tax=Glycomyces sp. NRRL B-16210 TaxID=1463821 RepID=UPI000B08E350|nr:nucleoside 2-deoxyribosyltransferase [Glycomyces sp. NRRL B-16210]